MISFFKKIFGLDINYKSLIDGGAIVIDVRTPQEFDNGHIKGSRNIPMNLIQREIASLKKTGKPFITVCQSGGRSAMVKSTLKAAGIEVYNGGGWMSLQNKIRS